MNTTKTIKTAITAAIVSGSFLVGQKFAPKLTTIEQIESSGKKQYVVLSPEGHDIDFQTQNSIAGALNVTDSSDESFTVQANEKEVEELKKSIPSGWQVVEDRIYSIKFGCVDPVKQPPVEQPAPSPTPVVDNQKPSVVASVPWGIKKIKADEALKVSKADSVLVCITDTGADVQHADLKGMIVGGKSSVPGTGSFDDDQGHGTHVAGIIAASLNQIDVVGVTQSKLFISKVLDSTGQGYSSWIADGINECIKQNAQVISMSLGAPASAGSDPVIARAVSNALARNIKVVVAAGNDSGPVGWPAAQTGVIAVSATDSLDRIATFSSRGPQIMYAAPGVNILSTQNGGGVTSMSGTSMATPHVAGVVALSLATGKPVAVDNVGLSKELQGLGRVNALKTVRGE